MGRPVHVPVMSERVVALLTPAVAGREAVLVDATLGLAGHAEALLAEHPHLRLVGLDRDGEALARSRERLEPYEERVTLVHAVYEEIAEILTRLGHERVHAVLFDLGVSSLQVDVRARGFAYARDAPLDMRMDPSHGITAAEVVNTYPAERLSRVIHDYGEERFAGRIARAVARERTRQDITSTKQLADIVRGAIPAAARRTGGHPVKRTFQALRIEVNGELETLQRALPQAIGALALHGRIVVLSYHSLEDRLAKRALADRARDTTPASLPVPLPEHQPELRLLTRRAEKPDAAEVAANPRATSARLRAAERIREAA